MTTGAAARALGVSHRVLLNWAEAGTVTPAWTTPGGQFRWVITDLRRQLKIKESTHDDVHRDPDPVSS